MSYLAQGLMNGFGQGFAAGNQRKLMEKKLTEDAKRDAIENSLREDAVIQRAKDEAANRQTARQNEIQQNLRHQDSQRANEAAALAKQNDPREVLARTKAERELATIQTPPPLSPEEEITQEVKRLRLEKERADLTGATPAPAPTAKVRQPIGKGGYAEFEAPVSEIPNLAKNAAAEGYRSPYARQLTALEKTIADEQAAIDSGDNRTGFLGVGTSRADTVAKAQRERMRLKALDLQAKVKAGVLTQEEADAEADNLMTGTR